MQHLNSKCRERDVDNETKTEDLLCPFTLTPFLPGLVNLPVEGPIRSCWFLAHHKSKSLSPVASTFLDWIQHKENLKVARA